MHSSKVIEKLQEAITVAPDAPVQILTDTILEDGEIGIITGIQYNPRVGSILIKVEGADSE